VASSPRQIYTTSRDATKGTDLSQVTQTQLNDIAELMNNRPRKTLDFKTPNEVMAEELNQTARECCA